MLIGNTVFNLDDTVLARIQWSLYLGLYGFVVAVGMAMSILHLIGIRIPMSIPHFSLVQGYGHAHSVVFMVNVRLRIRSLHVWKHSGWVCVCICPFASCKPSNMKQTIQIHPVHISPDLTPSSLVLPDVSAKIRPGFNQYSKIQLENIYIYISLFQEQGLLVIYIYIHHFTNENHLWSHPQAATEVSKTLKQVA